jgi:hypothetical protein
LAFASLQNVKPIDQSKFASELLISLPSIGGEDSDVLETSARQSYWNGWAALAASVAAMCQIPVAFMRVLPTNFAHVARFLPAGALNTLLVASASSSRRFNARMTPMRAVHQRFATFRRHDQGFGRCLPFGTLRFWATRQLVAGIAQRRQFAAGRAVPQTDRSSIPSSQTHLSILGVAGLSRRVFGLSVT